MDLVVEIQLETLRYDECIALYTTQHEFKTDVGLFIFAFVTGDIQTVRWRGA